ncbi:MAG: DUF6531 domain-containing protein [Alphaproteobacteria bacterium]|nr:DUF6531 domain-containing protein [Alphaproteobacteria bacterium]
MKKLFFTMILVSLFFYSEQAHAMTSGTTTTGSIVSGGTSTQSFSGTAGQGVVINAYASYRVIITIYKPDGSYWTYAENRFSGNLPATGTYSVVISAGVGGGSGAYSLYYVRGGGGVSNGTLNSGMSYSGTLSPNGLNSYQFTGSAGQGMVINTSASYNMYISIYAPDGSYWGYGSDSYSFNLPTTGTYTVVLESTNSAYSGSYNLYYVRGGGDVSNGTLNSGMSYSGTLSPNGLNSYQFTGNAGQGMIIHTSAPYNINISVYKPDGSYWTYGSGRYSGNLPTTGTYNVVLSAGVGGGSGSYNLYYVRGAGGVSEGTIVSTLPRTGTLQANGLQSYKFTGSAGNSLSISTTASYSRYIELYKPDGSYWAYGAGSFSATLPVTGDYIIAYYASSASTTGGYSITMTTPPVSVAATDPTKEGQDCLPCDPSPTKEVGDPINFDIGYLRETATDYNFGGLSFSRIYRSDSTWTDNTIGQLWRHNYARTLDIAGTAASMTDGTGATTHYTLSGSDWVPDDASTTATLQNDGSGGYIYTLPDNTVEKYNSSKQLTRIEYVGGGALNLAYNGSGQLLTVTNENGRQLGFTYSSGRVATVSTPDGTFSYSYDTNGNLETVTKPDTKTIGYHYENTTYTHALTGITDESGTRYATFTYDANGKAIQSKLAGNVSSTDIDYNSGQTSTTTNALGKDTTSYYTNILGVRQIIQEDSAATTHTVASSRYFNYDEKGRLVGKTDWENNTTSYEYDSRSNITKITKAPGAADQQITTITYDPTYNLPDLVTEDGKTTDYDYDTYGRLTSITITDTATSETRVTTYSYYANSTDGSGNVILGRLHQVDGPRTDVGDVTAYAYDTNFNLTTITNPLSQVTTITSRDSAGRPTAIEDPNGVETDLAYDTNGRLQSSTRAVGTALEAETTYDYDDNGDLTKVTLPNGSYLQYSYDGAQRLTGIEDTLGNTITYTLDNAGNITKQDIKDSSSTLKYTHQQVFDELSRIIQSIGASSQTANYAYDKNSNLTSYTDPNTNATSYAYDALQRLVTQTDALSGVATQGYNNLDDMTSVKDQRNNTTSYTYNAFGDVTGESSPDRGSISYTVDKAGNITQMTDARSIVTNYTYDALNRVTSVSYPSNTSLNATMSYDLASGCGAAPKGHLCSVTDAVGTIAYQYDDLGRMMQEKDTRGTHDLITAYTYDLDDNVLTITLPSGRVVTYTRNANGQVSGVSATVNGTSTTLASSIGYLPFGPLSGLTYGNSLTLSVTYDQDYNPTNRTVSGGIYNHTYDTDDNGNITQVGSETFSYDDLDRLHTDNPGTNITYSYDATSNRLTKNDGTTVTTTVPSGSNKISAVGANSYTYDAAGNITDDDTNAYTWNAAGNLATVNSTTGVYSYDYLHRRAKKVAGSTTTYYVYGPDGTLYGEYDSSGDFIREYVYLNEAPIAQIDTGTPEVLTYLHTDHLGTPRFGTNTGGTQVWSWTSDGFGVGSTSGSRTVNLRMAGQYYDAESGLFYNWNRYYNPVIGRYISSDPIGIAGGLNTFLYAEASPVMYNDPEGKIIPILLGAAVFVAYEFTPQPANAPGVSDQVYPEKPFAPLQNAATVAALSCTVAAGVGENSLLFSRAEGLLNRNPYFRVGWGWKGTKAEGNPVFRISIGNKKAPIHKHIDLWNAD